MKKKTTKITQRSAPPEPFLPFEENVIIFGIADILNAFELLEMKNYGPVIL